MALLSLLVVDGAVIDCGDGALRLAKTVDTTATVGCTIGGNDAIFPLSCFDTDGTAC